MNRNTLDFSPDGRVVAIGLENGLVYIYNTESGGLVKAFNAHPGPITYLRFSPDRTRLATAATDRSVRVWDTATWRPTNLLKTHTTPVKSLQWLPDSRSLISTSGSYQISSYLWRVK